ncbi:alkaline phosphatase family protein [Aquibacillus albus]|uniref:AlkP superfamily pyrophosphatase or phosphodiesterase n=1 Tax=Aquibacillus albus TaxID=1168171 RepID=A0ABS2N5D0_9BACI|nr:alkaline phosphatase family protein [Aquibacillus albus]MBM7573336.1 putative AlkP superfamily pyrophosphatase or phosphodiesterase [Aquibacillus albus]
MTVFLLSISILLIITVLILLYIYFFQPINKINQLRQLSTSSSRRVVMIIIDSIMNKPLQIAIKEGKVPALEFFMNKGRYYSEMVSSYPTMSVTIDSTLLTGTYADKHKVPALVWYDEKDKRFISYGSARKEIQKLGMKQVFNNSLFHLNHEHLSGQVKTIHEELDGQSASINTLVYRGNNDKRLQVPRLLNMLNFLDKEDSVKAPYYFSYGLLSNLKPKNNYTHIWQAFGFNDKFATAELKYLIEQEKIPSFSIVYLADNDKKVHKNGVDETKGIEDADKQLQEILNTYDSWEEAIEENVWIVMGDSGQSRIGNDKDTSLIDLRKLLSDYQIHQISGPIKETDQIVLGLNERMSFIYLLDEQIKIKNLANKLNNDGRINFIAWKDGERVIVLSGNEQDTLSFKPEGNFTDQYGQTWELKGNTNALNLSINEDNQITYTDFPDALARLYSSFYSHSGRYLIVDAKPGFEFVGEGSPTHLGGASHGSLYKDDTYFPMIVTGTKLEPKHERMVDLKNWILRILKEGN